MSGVGVTLRVRLCACLVALHDAADPAVVAAHPGVDAGVSPHGTVVTPGHHPLQDAVTHQGATGVTLGKQRK